MSQTYRVAIIGCGLIARSHAGGYRRCLQTEIVAAADVDEARLGQFGQEWGLTSLYTDFRQMLKKERPDVVSICTWPQLHLEMTLEAARSGVKGILCEKPMALNLGDLDRMVQACEERGVKLATGHELRFFEQHLRAKELLQRGELGNVFWMRGIRMGGDIVTNAIHTIDLMRFFMDDAPIQWVFGQVEAVTGRRAYGHPTEDSAIAYMEFQNGVRAFLECGAFTSLGNHHVYVEGTEGRLEVNPRDLHDVEGPHLRVQRRGQGSWEEYRMDYTDYMAKAFQGVVQALVAWVDGGPESPTSARNARATQEAVWAALESARRGRIVRLPLESTDYFPTEALLKERGLFS